jgi:hypothetical protein
MDKGSGIGATARRTSGPLGGTGRLQRGWPEYIIAREGLATPTVLRLDLPPTLQSMTRQTGDHDALVDSIRHVYVVEADREATAILRRNNELPTPRPRC